MSPYMCRLLLPRLINATSTPSHEIPVTFQECSFAPWTIGRGKGGDVFVCISLYIGGAVVGTRAILENRRKKFAMKILETKIHG